MPGVWSSVIIARLCYKPKKSVADPERRQYIFLSSVVSKQIAKHEEKSSCIFAANGYKYGKKFGNDVFWQLNGKKWYFVRKISFMHLIA